MAKPALVGAAFSMTHPTLPATVRTMESQPSNVYIMGKNPVLGPQFTMTGVPAAATILTTVVKVNGAPVVLEGATVTCIDGYIGVIPVTGATPNFV
jgi:hypothetical protein